MEGAAGVVPVRSLLVGASGEVFVGAPVGVGFPTKSHVYMIEALIGGAVDLDEEAEKLTWDREGFGWTLAMLDEGELLVGIQQHNAVVKIESPLIGHPIPYTVSDPTTGDTFAYTDAIPTALTGEIDLGDEPSGDPQCGFTVAAGAFVDESGSQGIFVGCPGLNQPSVAYRDADWTDHSAFDALGWSVGTGDDGGSGVEQFGYSASVGDVNGDGFDDLLVGEPRADHGLRTAAPLTSTSVPSRILSLGTTGTVASSETRSRTPWVETFKWCRTSTSTATPRSSSHPTAASGLTRKWWVRERCWSSRAMSSPVT